MLIEKREELFIYCGCGDPASVLGDINAYIIITCNIKLFGIVCMDVADVFFIHLRAAKPAA